ncbi:MAG: hypothetical protein M3P85_08365 [Actinomycetota bacterium]|nr:hypothetical protein [Actinomycetota bacterium]
MVTVALAGTLPVAVAARLPLAFGVAFSVASTADLGAAFGVAREAPLAVGLVAAFAADFFVAARDFAGEALLAADALRAAGLRGVSGLGSSGTAGAAGTPAPADWPRMPAARAETLSMPMGRAAVRLTVAARLGGVSPIAWRWIRWASDSRSILA